MRQGIAVGMAHRPLVEWHLDAAENQLAPRGQAVQIIADARPCSMRGLLRGALLRQIKFRQFQIARAA